MVVPPTVLSLTDKGVRGGKKLERDLGGAGEPFFSSLDRREESGKKRGLKSGFLESRPN